MPTTRSSTRIITLDALIQDDPPTISLGGQTFQGHQASWAQAARFEGQPPRVQLGILTDLLRERAEDPEAITAEWLDRHLSMKAVDGLVAVLFRGEDPTAPKGKGNG
jgi:hypothetical protein